VTLLLLVPMTLTLLHLRPRILSRLQQMCFRSNHLNRLSLATIRSRSAWRTCRPHSWSGSSAF